jgi:hypothetical protein
LHDGSQPIHYIEGNFYTFLNHLDYNFKDLNGEHPTIVAFCTDAETPLFCAPMLFEDANIHDINDKLVELFNKEPYNEKLMDEESWVTFRCTLYDHFGKKTFSNALKTISAKDITDTQSNREHIPSR